MIPQYQVNKTKQHTQLFGQFWFCVFWFVVFVSFKFLHFPVFENFSFWSFVANSSFSRISRAGCSCSLSCFQKKIPGLATPRQDASLRSHTYKWPPITHPLTPRQYTPPSHPTTPYLLIPAGSSRTLQHTLPTSGTLHQTLTFSTWHKSDFCDIISPKYSSQSFADTREGVCIFQVWIPNLGALPIKASISLTNIPCLFACMFCSLPACISRFYALRV